MALTAGSVVYPWPWLQKKPCGGGVKRTKFKGAKKPDETRKKPSCDWPNTGCGKGPRDPLKWPKPR